MQLDKTYDPHKVEDKWYAHWLEQGYFHGDSSRGGKPYCIVIPPPNVTGILHMGHALNNTIQDVLIRWRRMQGRNTVWVPGTDHAGIATQNVVERELKKEGKTRDDLGREAFLERVWQWREVYGKTITNQLKKLGASCDWDRKRFTIDEGLSNAVSEVFIRLYKKGYIYRGNYIIHWCPRCHTALSDEESEHKEVSGKLYYIRYPIKDTENDYVVVATTRPETLLGDAAVAIHPEDTRYNHLTDQPLLLPILNRELPIVQDDFVDPTFGTGAVKVTPAHDPNDFEIGQRHGLTPLNVMNHDGTMNEDTGPYAGMDRFACRKKLIEDLKATGLLEKIDDHDHAVGHCYRCHTRVEPRLSPQWFVKMKPLAQPALQAVKEGRIRFVPDRWTKVYSEWMEHIRDWCISRQIWWGHRIPIFYCDACNHEWAANSPPSSCSSCGSNQIRQDEDVLDTWFSSWLWPFSVYGWPEQNEDLKFYYPTNTLVTASEIIFFWVARMIMSGIEFMDDIPFTDVYIHGTVRDDTGLKMSKSLGNSIDPLDIIEKYSADALRFSLIMITATGSDVYLSDEKFEIGRNFVTKIWNAARFMQLHAPVAADNFHNPTFDLSLHMPDDHHILSKCHEAIEKTSEHLERFRFNDVAHVLYEFVWHQYCDWYVEYSKQTLYGEDEQRKEHVLKVMHYVFSNALCLLHPLMPFVTEELWHAMGYQSLSKTIMHAPWPQTGSKNTLALWGVNPDSVSYVEAKHDLIRVGRNLRSDYRIPPKQEVECVIRPSEDEHVIALKADENSIKALLKVSTLTVDKNFVPAGAMPSGLTQLGAVYISIAEYVDIENEIKRLSVQLEKVNQDLERVRKKLANQHFVSKAPKEVVATQEHRKIELCEKVEKLQKLINTFSQQ
ncbi:MAG: valine--tRNA ligase [Kiritimatiellae bacterium]|nr:valine--tRNA ligase [Kiritimatiellia bacterium]